MILFHRNFQYHLKHNVVFQIVSEKLEIEHKDISTVGTQVTLVGATVPRDLEGIFGDIVPVGI